MAGSTSSSSATSITTRRSPVPARAGAGLLQPRHVPEPSPALFHNVTGAGRPAALRGRDAALGTGPGCRAPGWGSCCADFDGDGWPDIFVANDGKPNHLWVNQRDGTFKEEAVRRGVAYNGLGQAQAGMGVALGDVDGDGLEDVFVTHLAEETDTLWVQGPRGLFRDRTGGAGLAAPRWHGTGFGTVLADFDLDGALDLAVVNGNVRRGGPAVPGRRRWGRTGRPSRSATSCSSATAQGTSATCRRRKRRCAARPTSAGAWSSATWTATGRPTCC